MARRHALIVGIDHYAHLEERYQLRGCVNDARAVAAILQARHGFAAGDVVLLVNAEATRTAMLAAMDALVARIGDDDFVHLHFSGHGSTRSNADGSEGAGHDSTLMPHDSGRGPAPDLDILDDELHGWLARLGARTQYTSLVFDCCHSGTLSRGAAAGRVRSVPPFPRARAAAPPQSSTSIGTRGTRWRGVASAEARHVLLSACRDDEEAHETPPGQEGTPTHGALTWFLLRALATCAQGNTWRDVFEQVAPEVRALHGNQHPQLQGRMDLPLFGEGDVPALGNVVVTAVDVDVVELDAGAAHGIGIGSRWQLHAPQSKEGALQAAPVPAPVLATVEVRALGAIAARATVLEASQPPEVGMRATELTRVAGDSRVAVQVVLPGADDAQPHLRAIEAVREALASSGLCRLAGADESAGYRLLLLLPGAAAGGTDGAALATRVDRPSWMLVDPQGTLLAPVHAIDLPDVASRMCANIEARIRFRNLLALRNTDRGTALRGMLGLRLYRRVGPGFAEEQRDREAWTEALPGADGEVHFRAGDGIALRITNRAPRPLFVAAIDFDARASITTLFPNDGSSALLAENASITVGLPADGWALDIPPLQPDAGPDTSAGGRQHETIKVFASTAATDFRALRQEGTRGAGAPGDALTALVALACQGGDSAPVAVDQATATRGLRGTDWTTTMRSFVVDP